MFAVPAWLLFVLGFPWLAPAAQAAPESPHADGSRAAAAASPAPLPAPLTGEALLRELPPAELEARLARQPALVEPALIALADALASPDAALAGRTADYLAAAARARSHRLPAAASESELDALMTLLLVHPGRFGADPGFRSRVLAFLPRALDARTPPALRERVLAELNRVDGVDFAAAERVEVAWGMASRESAGRRSELPAAFTFEDDLSTPIAASVYSLPAYLVDLASATRFLAAVRALAPRRELLAMTDLPLAVPASAGGAAVLSSDAAPTGTAAPTWEVLPTFGRAFSLWPRDPFSLVRRADGGLLVLLRPNVQPGREEDAFLGRELIEGLPERLDAAWGRPRWAVALVPFHNGQVLLTRDAAWMSLHGLELRALEILGLPAVPAADFARPEGVDRYMTAVRRAADELAALYRRPVRFVHPDPAALPAAERPGLMARLAGGAGHDLDSLVTLLPGRNGRLRALVADVAAGRALLAAAPAAEWEGFRRGYGLAPPAAALPAALAAALAEPSAAALGVFLDTTAAHLAAQGLTVERLPLLLVPTALLAGRGELTHPRFMVTWNNVAVETRDGRVRAEGFSSLLPEGDRRAAAAFARAGVRLDYLPPLVESVIRIGGYRCASNQLRQPATQR
jgi:hypothetical protein